MALPFSNQNYKTPRNIRSILIVFLTNFVAPPLLSETIVYYMNNTVMVSVILHIPIHSALQKRIVVYYWAVL